MNRAPRSRLPSALSAVLTLAACQAGSDADTPMAAGDLQALLHEVAATAPAEVAGGKALFEQYCSVCHGPVADGTEQGPPLADRIYEPSHHADAAFILAVRIGVRSHHWRFGDMEPLPDVTDDMTRAITSYVRWLQRQVGIE